MTLPDSVSKEYVESIITRVEYINPEGTALTLCLLHCKNGFICVGESACAVPSRYDPALGQKYSYENAFDKLWAHEGYVLKTKRYEQSLVVEQKHPSDARTVQDLPVTNLPVIMS